MNETELTYNKSTQLHDAFIGHARMRHDYTACWLAAEKLGRNSAGLVLNVRIPLLLFTGICEVQFSCCEQAFELAAFIAKA